MVKKGGEKETPPGEKEREFCWRKKINLCADMTMWLKANSQCPRRRLRHHLGYPAFPSSSCGSNGIQPFLPFTACPWTTCRAVQAANSSQPRSPSQGRATSPVADEAPASPIVHCFQYRMEEYERQNGPLHGPRAREGRWLALQHPGGVRVRLAVVLPDAARRPPQGSTLL